MWPALCKFRILFSTVKLKLGHKVSQFIHLKVGSKLDFPGFPNSQRN